MGSSRHTPLVVDSVPEARHASTPVTATAALAGGPGENPGQSLGSATKTNSSPGETAPLKATVTDDGLPFSAIWDCGSVESYVRGGIVPSGLMFKTNRTQDFVLGFHRGPQQAPLLRLLGWTHVVPPALGNIETWGQKAISSQLPDGTFPVGKEKENAFRLAVPGLISQNGTYGTYSSFIFPIQERPVYPHVPHVSLSPHLTPNSARCR